MDNQNNKDWQTAVFESAVRNKEGVVSIFKSLYFIILGLILVSFPAAYAKNTAFNFLAENSAYFGRAALFLLFIIVTPGILGRFNIQIKITRIITVYRRNLGILMFLVVFTHYHLVNLPKIAGIEPFTLSLPLFQTVGFSAFVLLSFLFLTSNNFSVRKLGRWWKRIHRLIYVVLWLVLAHTALQRVSIYSVMAGIFATLEVVSLLYSYYRSKISAQLAK